MNYVKRKDHPFGLDKTWRIDWSIPENNLAVVLGKHGLHTKFIAKKTGLSPDAVTYRLKFCGVRLKDYRNGIGLPATRVLKKYTVKTVKGTDIF